MNSALVIALFSGFVALMILVAVLSALAAKKRREAFAALATAHGWSYTARDDRWTESFLGSPFGLGHDRQAINVVSGQYDGRGFVSFDFVYHTTESSTDSKGHHQSREVSHPFGVVALDVGASFPALEVNPEGMFGRLVGHLTGRDIELESEDFNRAFTVTCADRKFASDVLHPRMMEYLLTHPDSAFRFDRSWVLSVESGRADIEQVEPRLAHIDSVLDNVPDFVWRQVRGG